jgi:tRNA(adenine34) deaminase
MAAVKCSAAPPASSIFFRSPPTRPAQRRFVAQELLLTTTDQHWMQLALDEARQAAAVGEVPVGAVLVRDNQLIGAGFNQPIRSCDPTAHAEIVALRAAAAHLANYRLPATTLYVTIEPCAMGAGALIHARLARLVFGAVEPRAGAIVSATQLLDAPQFNHRVSYEGGVLAPQCAELMRQFFQDRRGAT